LGGTTCLHLQGKSIRILQAPSKGRGRIFLQNAGSSCLCAFENYVLASDREFMPNI